MNLQEYVNQKNPQRMEIYNVRIQSKELRFNGTVLNKIGIDMHNVTLLHFGLNYIILGESGSLWTIDENGNPKQQSIFYLTIN